MIRNINTKTKLLLFPLMFLIIVVISGVVYSHFSGKENSRTDIAMETDEFIQEVLKGRISVYQFLRAPNDDTRKKVVDNFQTLDKNVSELKSILTMDKNITLCNDKTIYQKIITKIS